MTLTATFINHFLNEYKQYYKLFVVLLFVVLCFGMLLSLHCSPGNQGSVHNFLAVRTFPHNHIREVQRLL